MRDCDIIRVFLSMVACQSLCRHQDVSDYGGMSEIVTSSGCFLLWLYVKDCDAIRVFLRVMAYQSV